MTCPPCFDRRQTGVLRACGTGLSEWTAFDPPGRRRVPNPPGATAWLRGLLPLVCVLVNLHSADLRAAQEIEAARTRTDAPAPLADDALLTRVQRQCVDYFWSGAEPVYWSPEHGWDMNFKIGGYNECLIVYVLAASSPTHGVPASVYHRGWARDGGIRTDRRCHGLPVVLDHYEHDDACVGPLFWAHYSYVGLNPNGLSDRYADYWQLNRNHALIHHAHCVENPHRYRGYGPECWGLTSSYSMTGYAGHRPDRDLGVISPTAALSSFPYTPEQSMAFLRFLYEKSPELVGIYGPYDAFSPERQWHLPRYLAIDQGPIPVMIENHRFKLLWRLFMSADEVQAGLRKLGFKSDP